MQCGFHFLVLSSELPPPPSSCRMKVFLAALAFTLQACSQSVPPTNLPPSVAERAPDAVFAANASKLLSGTTIDEAWQVLLDFDTYAEWNPFVR